MAVRQGTCTDCGAQFVQHGPGRLASRCKPCRAEALKAYHRERDRQRERDYSGRVRRERTGPAFCCKVCRKSFVPKRSNFTTCCSRECGWVWGAHLRWMKGNGGRPRWRVTRRPRPKPTVVYDHPPAPVWCTMCGRGFYRRSPRARQCSPECREAARRASRERERERARVCPDARARKSAARLAGKMARRAARVEMVNPFAVFERDGWKCRLCGVRTPKRLRGTYEPRAPELDHIIPIAVGGEHSYRNVQLACRECNLGKGASPKGQLLLFG